SSTPGPATRERGDDRHDHDADEETGPPLGQYLLPAHARQPSTESPLGQPVFDSLVSIGAQRDEGDVEEHEPQDADHRATLLALPRAAVDPWADPIRRGDAAGRSRGRASTALPTKAAIAEGLLVVRAPAFSSTVHRFRARWAHRWLAAGGVGRRGL